jgi:hypothetical protein
MANSLLIYLIQLLPARPSGPTGPPAAHFRVLGQQPSAPHAQTSSWTSCIISPAAILQPARTATCIVLGQPPGQPWYHRTGPEAVRVQLVAELVLALSLNLKGVPLTAGPNEQMAYIYQSQLSDSDSEDISKPDHQQIKVSLFVIIHF